MRLTNFAVQNKLILEILFLPENKPEKLFRFVLKVDISGPFKCYGFGSSIREAVDNYTEEIKGGILISKCDRKLFVPDVLKGSKKEK